MLVDLDDTGPQPGQVPRADGMVAADEVADAKRGKSGSRANGVKEPAACVDSLGERGELIVVVACDDGTQQGQLASDHGQAPMPRGSLPHDPGSMANPPDRSATPALRRHRQDRSISAQAATEKASEPTACATLPITAVASSCVEDNQHRGHRRVQGPPLGARRAAPRRSS
jgi:hypothetical protein